MTKNLRLKRQQYVKKFFFLQFVNFGFSSFQKKKEKSSSSNSDKDGEDKKKPKKKKLQIEDEEKRALPTLTTSRYVIRR